MKVILAPSSAGKTHFVERNYDVCCDGDDVVSRSIGWPLQWVPDRGIPAEWWRTNVGATISNAAARAVVAYARSGTDRRAILFNGRPGVFAASGLRIVCVIPPDEQLIEHVRLKIRDQSAGRHVGQPVETATILRNAADLRRAAERAGWAVHRTFETALPEARSQLPVLRHPPVNLPAYGHRPLPRSVAAFMARFPDSWRDTRDAKA